MPTEARPYRRCTRTIMDTTDPDIWFDDAGASSHAVQLNSVIAAESGREHADVMREGPRLLALTDCHALTVLAVDSSSPVRRADEAATERCSLGSDNGGGHQRAPYPSMSAWTTRSEA